MSGIHFSSPLHAAASVLAVVPREGHGAARPTRATPAVSLILSGVAHAVLLTVFLVLTTRAPEPEVPTFKIRVKSLPPISMQAPPTTRHDGAKAPPSDRGIFAPVDKKDGPDIETEQLFDPPTVDGPVGRNGQPAGDPGRAGPNGAMPAVEPPPPTNVVLAYDEPPVPIYHPDPKYSDIARTAGLEGLVRLEVVVTSEGSVRNVTVLEGNVMLADDAKQTVLTWKFRPGKRKGHPIMTRVEIPVRFILRD